VIIIGSGAAGLSAVRLHARKAQGEWRAKGVGNKAMRPVTDLELMPGLTKERTERAEHSLKGPVRRSMVQSYTS
jgi:hypothetical protein